MELGKGYISDIIIRMSYDANQNVEYVGKAAAGAATSDDTWQITNLTYDVNQNVTAVLYASGDKKFDKIWDDRALYVYS